MPSPPPCRQATSPGPGDSLTPSHPSQLALLTCQLPGTSGQQGQEAQGREHSDHGEAEGVPRVGGAVAPTEAFTIFSEVEMEAIQAGAGTGCTSAGLTAPQNLPSFPPGP